MKQSKEYLSQDTETLQMVNEPSAIYQNLNTIIGAQNFAGNKIKNDVDLINLSRAGLKKNSLLSVAGYLGVGLNGISSLLHTSYRNLQRKDDEALLDTYKTEKVLELGTFVANGVGIIGNENDFREWLHSPLMALGNKKPIEFLDTSFGIQMVNKILGRLQMGVYS